MSCFSHNCANGQLTLAASPPVTANSAPVTSAAASDARNTATGESALLSNTIGFSNTATGVQALFSNTTGNYNTATGDSALFSNIDGSENTATGFHALHENTTGTFNTATGQTEVSSTPNPDVFQWGFAVEYSLIYLQEHVKDVGLRAPFDRMIPLVEFSMSTPVERHGGTTTGTISPGVIWSGKYCQFGIEAVLPVNEHTGFNPGVVAQVHFYLDDIFPGIFSKPLL